MNNKTNFAEGILLEHCLVAAFPHHKLMEAVKTPFSSSKSAQLWPCPNPPLSVPVPCPAPLHPALLVHGTSVLQLLIRVVSLTATSSCSSSPPLPPSLIDSPSSGGGGDYLPPKFSRDQVNDLSQQKQHKEEKPWEDAACLSHWEHTPSFREGLRREVAGWGEFHR